jgi:hypothetical protein
MNVNRLKWMEWLGVLAAALLVLSLFMPWFGLSDVPERAVQDSWVCGEGVFSCSAWDSLGFWRWLFLASALAPILMLWFVATDEMGKYPTGEFTMTVGFVVMVLVFFNGPIVKPGDGVSFGLSLKWGWVLAMLSGILIAIAGAARSLESGGGPQRKPPATF